MSKNEYTGWRRALGRLWGSGSEPEAASGREPVSAAVPSFEIEEAVLVDLPSEQAVLLWNHLETVFGTLRIRPVSVIELEACASDLQNCLVMVSDGQLDSDGTGLVEGLRRRGNLLPIIVLGEGPSSDPIDVEPGPTRRLAGGAGAAELRECLESLGVQLDEEETNFAEREAPVSQPPIAEEKEMATDMNETSQENTPTMVPEATVPSTPVEVDSTPPESAGIDLAEVLASSRVATADTLAEVAEPPIQESAVATVAGEVGEQLEQELAAFIQSKEEQPATQSPAEDTEGVGGAEEPIATMVPQAPMAAGDPTESETFREEMMSGLDGSDFLGGEGDPEAPDSASSPPSEALPIDSELQSTEGSGALAAFEDVDREEFDYLNGLRSLRDQRKKMLSSLLEDVRGGKERAALLQSQLDSAGGEKAEEERKRSTLVQELRESEARARELEERLSAEATRAQTERELLVAQVEAGKTEISDLEQSKARLETQFESAVAQLEKASRAERPVTVPEPAEPVTQIITSPFPLPESPQEDATALSAPAQPLTAPAGAAAPPAVAAVSPAVAAAPEAVASVAPMPTAPAQPPDATSAVLGAGVAFSTQAPSSDGSQAPLEGDLALRGLRDELQNLG